MNWGKMNEKRCLLRLTQTILTGKYAHRLTIETTPQFSGLG